ncbi:acyltransferase [Erwinia sp. Eh17-17]|uniref:acyltransferase n=1 Tax=Erwinia sp. Eh17-17 TaxID=3080330 RepID=UPI00320823BF
MLFKLKWFTSAIFLSFFLKKIKFPTYFAFPVFFKGLNRVSVGKKVRVFPGCRLETHGVGEIIIEDNVSIAQNVHLTSGAKLIIGENSLITANVFITTIDHDYRDISMPMAEQKLLVNDTIIGKNCFIGMGAAIQAGTKLGQHCVVGANSVVRGEFPDFCVIVGSPARIVKKYNHDSGVWERV